MMVNIVKGCGSAPPTLTRLCKFFHQVGKYAESANCHFVCTLWSRPSLGVIQSTNHRVETKPRPCIQMYVHLLMPPSLSRLMLSVWFGYILIIYLCNGSESVCNQWTVHRLNTERLLGRLKTFSRWGLCPTDAIECTHTILCSVAQRNTFACSAEPLDKVTSSPKIITTDSAIYLSTKKERKKERKKF